MILSSAIWFRQKAGEEPGNEAIARHVGHKHSHTPLLHSRIQRACLSYISTDIGTIANDGGK